MSEVDDKALKILFNTYWNKKGSIPEQEIKILDEDLQYAKAAGVMFEPIVLRHDELVANIRDLCREVEFKATVSAFVSSLSTRRLEWRSALGTFVVMRHLQEHQLVKRLGFCTECHFFEDNRPTDLSVLNFERFKWGGARHTEIEYALLDLTQFASCVVPEPNAEDRRLLKSIVKAISEMPINTSAKKCAKLLKGGFPSSFGEREVLLAILGYCSILQDPAHPGFLDRFVPDSQRSLPNLEVSMANSTYPISWWNSGHGINRDALVAVFGDFL